MKLSNAIKNFMRGYFRSHRRAPKTRAAYRADLSQFLRFTGEDFSLAALATEEVRRWVAQLSEQGDAPATVRRKTASLRVFCEYQAERGEMKESPFWRIEESFGEVSPPPQTLSRRRLRALRERARLNVEIAERRERQRPTPPLALSHRASFRALRDLVLVELFCSVGLRLNEARSLDVDDYQARDAVLKIHSSQGRVRRVGLEDEEAKQSLRDYLEVRRRVKGAGSALFINLAGRRLSAQGIDNALVRLSREMGLRPRASASVIRGSVERHLLEKRVDARRVMALMGKKTLSAAAGNVPLDRKYLISQLRKHHPSASR